MRLIGLIFGVFGISFFVLALVRFGGLSQSYKEFETPYFSVPANPTAAETGLETVSIIIPWEQSFWLQKMPHLILWTEVYRGDGETLLVKPWVDRDKALKTLEKVANPARPLLKDLLVKFPQTRFVVQCNDNVENIHRQLAQVIEEAKATERVLIQSNYNSILVSTKELLPRALYGSSPADYTRLKVFDSLWILPSVPFKGDVFFGPLIYRGRSTINSDIVIEMKRRFKKVFLGPLLSQEEVDKAIALGADGLFVEDPIMVHRPASPNL
ncbi:MAG: hypothetical protein COT73_05980 [Bdellovibrio sp. CG10_big_fil_rev_8_21_14_0_10_47_8]|nr:MAG: hypothetical protein COT73_05980 [Bdellovibrio sp. CG10_big_fil_rev_8_21_14_0_10_47_8]